MQRISGLGAVGGGGGRAPPPPPLEEKKGEQSRNKNDLVYGTHVCAPEKGGGLVAWGGGDVGWGEGHAQQQER